jgi:hypothetical protein
MLFIQISRTVRPYSYYETHPLYVCDFARNQFNLGGPIKKKFDATKTQERPAS